MGQSYSECTRKQTKTALDIMSDMEPPREIVIIVVATTAETDFFFLLFLVFVLTSAPLIVDMYIERTNRQKPKMQFSFRFK